MDLRNAGNNFFTILEDMLDLADQEPEKSRNAKNPSRAYVQDAKAMAATPADVVEYPNSHAFVVDMPGIKANEIRGEDNVLVVSGERRREKEERVGKFMRKFVPPENVNLETISVVAQGGVLTVRVEKLPPAEPKRAKSRAGPEFFGAQCKSSKCTIF
ncbi:17.1 kDa class II heat shock protein-like [Pyrus x bretschneideri]|uniref:17.1 kDa class II heat shock protein-like n=1 Tax=Pyrus x bretschneideri TaxID=225117 RepID=UPI0005115245|nr:17.1 kDa class II heat shock protein-like [Pyrus x bretschneideri]